MSKYVIFQEIETPIDDPAVTHVDLVFVKAVDGGGAFDTSLRAHATVFPTAREAYEFAGRYPKYADWRVGVR